MKVVKYDVGAEGYYEWKLKSNKNMAYMFYTKTIFEDIEDLLHAIQNTPRHKIKNVPDDMKHRPEETVFECKTFDEVIKNYVEYLI